MEIKPKEIMQRKMKLMTTYKNSVCYYVYCVFTIVEEKQLFLTDMAILNNTRQGLKGTGKDWKMLVLNN